MPRSALARLARPAGSPLIGPRIQAALGAVTTLATIGLSQGSAQAYVVSVGGVQYDVTFFTGTYNDNTSKFQNAANGGVMPWWGNQATATEFATAVRNRVDTRPGSNPTLFGYNIIPGDYSLGMVTRIGASYFNVDGQTYSDQYYDIGNYTWAKATLFTPPAAPAPGPLPILGAAAAFGASRKLRRRMKAIKVIASRATVV